MARGVSPNRLFTSRRPAEKDAPTATQAEEEVAPASRFRAQQEQIRELQRLLGKKTLENEILKEIAARQKKHVAVAAVARGRFAMICVCETIGVPRSNVAERAAGRPQKRRGRPPLPDDQPLAEIQAVIADMPTHGYARVWAILRRQALAEGCQPANRKRV